MMESCRTIKVTFPSPGTSLELLELFFESRKRCGGGDIEEITAGQPGEFFITYMEETAAARVSSLGNVLLNKMKATIELCQVKEVDEEESAVPLPPAQSCAVTVERVSAATQEQVVRMYFQSLQRSGGAPIRDLHNNTRTNKYTLTFESPEVVPRVLKKEQLLDGCQLVVTRLEPKTDESDFEDLGADMYKDMVLVRHIPATTSMSILVNFLEHGSGCKVVDWKSCARDLTTGLVQFGEGFVLRRLVRHCCQFPFSGSMLGLRPIPRSSRLQVHGINELPPDSLTTYFTSLQEGVTVHVRDQNHHAIVDCQTVEVAEQINEQQHCIHHVPVTVSILHECLGVVPPGFDMKSYNKLSSEGFVKNLAIESHLLRFLKISPNLKSDLDLHLVQHHAKVDWNNYQSQTLKLWRTHNTKITETEWQAMVTRAVEDYLTKYHFEKMKSTRTIVSTIVKKTKPAAYLNSGKVLIEFSHGTEDLVVVGFKDNVNDVIGEVRTINDREMTKAERMRNPKQLSVSLSSTNFKIVKCMDMNQFGEDVDVEMGHNLIIFSGLQGEIYQAKLKLLEILSDVETKQCDLPSLQLRLISADHVVKRVTSGLRKRGLWAAMEVDGTTLLVSTQKNHMDEVVRTISEEVVFSEIKIDKEVFHVLPLDTLQVIVSDLESLGQGSILISTDSNARIIKIACLPELLTRTEKQMREFLLKYSTVEERLDSSLTHLPSAIVSSLSNAMTPSIKDIETQHQVVIQVHKLAENMSYVITGLRDKVNKSVGSLKYLERNIVRKNFQIKKPGIYKYFSSVQGRQYLQSLERSQKVAINVVEDAESTMGRGHQEAVFTIYGISSDSLEETTRKVYDIYDERYQRKVIGGPSSDPLSALVRLLDKAEEAEIEALGETHDVLIKVKGSRIDLEGAVSDLLKAMDAVMNKLFQVQLKKGPKHA